MGSARDIGNTSAKQTFLKIERELSKESSKPVKSLAKGQTVVLPFKLTIPVHADGACIHPIIDEELRKEHHVLPPCLSVRGPDTVEIQYHIMFVTQARPLHTVTTTETVTCQPIIVIPTRLSWPNRLSSIPSIKEIKLKSRFSMCTLGELQIFSHYTVPIFRDIRQTEPLSSKAVTVSLILKFFSKIGAKPPQIQSVKRRLITQTFLSTVPWQHIPMKYPGLALSKQRGILQEVTQLSELKPRNINWRMIPAEELEKANSRDETVHTCRLDIPIIPTADMDTIPTFYSCLIARKYIARFSLRFYSKMVGYSSVSLEVPVDIVFPHGQGKDSLCTLS